MSLDTGPVAQFVAVAWWALATVIVWIGWRRRNRVLLVIGALMLAVGAWNTAVSLSVRGL